MRGKVPGTRGRLGRFNWITQSETFTTQPLPTSPNECWSLDFIIERKVNGEQVQLLLVKDGFTQELVAKLAVNSSSGAQIACELDALGKRVGTPVMIVSDGALLWHSRVILAWAKRNNIDWRFISPRNCGRVH